MAAFNPPTKNNSMIAIGLIFLLGLLPVFSYHGGFFSPLNVSFSNGVSLSNSTSAVRWTPQHV
jgi:hypothetical protein